MTHKNIMHMNIKMYCVRKYHTSKLQYISDIHLEYKKSFPVIPKVGNHLALLGDIGNPFKPNYTEFIKYTSKNWNKVFLLSGNHEYWQEKYDIHDVDNKIRDITTKFNNVIFLNNQKYSLDNYTILGSTLWSKINKKPLTIMGDDQNIKYNGRNIAYNELNDMFDASHKWLSVNINESKSPIIVLTHHLPSYKLIIEKFKTGYFAPYHDRFASNLDNLIKDPVKFWLCGHSHCNIEMNINNVYCGINALGYQKKSSCTIPLKFIQL